MDWIDRVRVGITLCAVIGGPSALGADVDALIDRAAGQSEVMDAAGLWTAPPESQELHEAILRNELTAAQWDRLIERSRILPDGLRWIVDTPIVVLPTAPAWVGEGGSVRVTAVGYSSRGEARARALQGWTGLTRRDLLGFRDPLTIDALPLGEHEVRCHVSVDVWSADRKTHVTHEGAFNRTITVVESGALKPVSTPELDRAVRDSIEIRLFAGTDGRGFLVSYPHGDTSALERFDNIGFGAIVEVLDDRGSVVTTDRVPLNPFDKGTYVYTLTATSEPVRGPIPLGEASRGWTVRVRGDEGAALGSGDADSYWSGEFILPLAEVRFGPDAAEAPAKSSE